MLSSRIYQIFQILFENQLYLLYIYIPFLIIGNLLYTFRYFTHTQVKLWFQNYSFLPMNMDILLSPHKEILKTALSNNRDAGDQIGGHSSYWSWVEINLTSKSGLQETLQNVYGYLLSFRISKMTSYEEISKISPQWLLSLIQI